MVDDRLQRPMRKLIRESNGIRVLVGLLRYRRQVVVADAVRLRAALCLLGLAHDVHIAQVRFARAGPAFVVFFVHEGAVDAALFGGGWRTAFCFGARFGSCGSFPCWFARGM